jgi:hypothetical protein
VAIDQLSTLEWEEISLLLWQAPLPEGEAARQVGDFVARGGFAVFLPPKSPGQHEIFGARWSNWIDRSPKEPNGTDLAVANWRGDQDLLAHTQSGAMLPAGQLQIHRSCGMKGEFTPLATLKDGAPLLARCADQQQSGSKHGSAYFLTTTPAPSDSSLANNGVVLYVLVQRALAGGAAALGNVRQLAAGENQIRDGAPWQRVAGAENALSTEYPYNRGVYTEGKRLLAVNRPLAEDQAPVLDDGQVVGLFHGLDFVRVDHQAGRLGVLIQEIWRPFLASMIIALLVEAGLCFPRKAPNVGNTA